MRVELGACPCCKADLEMEIEFSATEFEGRLITRIARADVRAFNAPTGEGSSLAHKVLVNAKKRHGNHRGTGG